MDIKTNLNPVGVVQEVAGFSDMVERLKTNWVVVKAQFGKVNWSVGVQFLSKCLDQLVCYLVDQNLAGADKKATVLDAFSKIFDTVVADLFPIWLKPFSSTIKNFVVNVALSHVIDFVVEKYKNGSWKN